MDPQYDCAAIYASLPPTVSPVVPTTSTFVKPKSSRTRVVRHTDHIYGIPRKVQQIIGFKTFPEPFARLPSMSAELERTLLGRPESPAMRVQAPTNRDDTPSQHTIPEVSASALVSECDEKSLAAISEDTESCGPATQCGVDARNLPGTTSCDLGLAVQATNPEPVLPKKSIHDMETINVTAGDYLQPVGPLDVKCRRTGNRPLLAYNSDGSGTTISGSNSYKSVSSGTRERNTVSLDSRTPRLVEDITGLPVLPMGQEDSEKDNFPGTTHALLTDILIWSCTMQSHVNRLPDPKPQRISEGLPYPVAAPSHHRLLSVAFYDTSIQPHRGVCFLGPGDAASITYGQVDTIRGHGHGSPIKKQIHPSNAEQRKREHSTHSGVAPGEGRWAYILIKGHVTCTEMTPPHVVIAFPTCAITDESSCLHTILPHSYLGTESCRSETTNSMLPTGSQTLSRRILKLGKAGGIPLIEGYRVNVGKFRDWLDAVGRGKGKLIMWEEM